MLRTRLSLSTGLVSVHGPVLEPDKDTVPTGTEGGRLTMHLCKAQKKLPSAAYDKCDVGDVL